MADLDFGDFLKCTWKIIDFSKWVGKDNKEKFLEITVFCGNCDNYNDDFPFTSSENTANFYIRPTYLKKAVEYFRLLANELEDIAIKNERAEYRRTMEEQIEKEMLNA